MLTKKARNRRIVKNTPLFQSPKRRENIRVGATEIALIVPPITVIGTEDGITVTAIPRGANSAEISVTAEEIDDE